MNDPARVSWQTVEYLHTEKTTDWYWIVSIVAISIAVIAIILHNLIFGILIIISSFTLLLFAGRKPETITVEINNLGVTVGKTRYPYGDLESFWIETREAYPKVLLKSKKVFMPFVVVLMNDVNHEQIHAVLEQHLPEKEHTEPFLEKLLLYLGF